MVLYKHRNIKFKILREVIIMEKIPSICFSLGTWLVLNGIGVELNLLFPIGFYMIFEGLRYGR